ncbi:MAG: FecR domain-containing protein [Planctomycetes bacterium]|nr:FecR domain-containing protein [Planctomycetota bacterium]
MPSCRKLDLALLLEAALVSETAKEIGAHLSECASCRSRWVDVKKIAGALRHKYGEVVPSPEGFETRILLAVEGAERPSSSTSVAVALEETSSSTSVAISLEETPSSTPAAAPSEEPPPSKLARSMTERPASGVRSRPSLRRARRSAPGIALGALALAWVLVVAISYLARGPVGGPSGNGDEDGAPPALEGPEWPAFPWAPAKGSPVAIRILPEGANVEVASPEGLHASAPSETGPADLLRAPDGRPLRIELRGEGTIDFAPGSWWRLSETGEGIQLDLAQGSALASAMGDELPFLVRTPHATVGPARGRFAVRVEEDGTGVAVLTTEGEPIGVDAAGRGAVRAREGDEAWAGTGPLMPPEPGDIFTRADWWTARASARTGLYAVEDAALLESGTSRMSPPIDLVPGRWHRVAVRAAAVEGSPRLVLALAGTPGNRQIEVSSGPEEKERLLFAFVPPYAGPGARGRIRIGVEDGGKVRFGRLSVESLEFPAAIVLAKRFRGGSLAGWNVHLGDWKIGEDALRAAPDAGAEPSVLYHKTGSDWADYSVRATLSIDGTARAGLLFRLSKTGHYRALVDAKGGSFSLEAVSPDGAARTIAEGPLRSSNGPWRTLEARVVDDRIRLRIDGWPAADLRDASVQTGTVALAVVGDGSARFLGVEVESEP